ncbi:MAG TPA: anaerobic ribonucleoside-triphosphate reductase activating protein [Lachnospiraceae bacterium]|jgi:pyruvate formate lyase activating enzyme|nr:anaerobic ribonucleoside-triphosphate reductase activating protein [Eubacteriales bacterium]HBI74169.1 anaerobic ribonucleoside-triphosphate reductase activating protein [Lachnospiraceae bacterium]HBY72453.1 anaerobic ribonucleoside-triphosphate reductase activating protein [Lachnospiraceae bacterium]HCA70545.1 anaerobic ribonucleoside-triphosphate reductase activating protein [Lachnospiraceae bacterium]HCM11884.1 anaerobic ribonucleoside-triphosphate reductase activating protein [Lachnospir
MQIHGFNKTTLLDYPQHLAATIFLGSCNMRCPFCHNSSLVLHPDSIPAIPTEEVLSYLAKRRGILEGVCITGGEPTVNPDLPDLIKEIKALGLKVKLDTNGSNPSLLKALVEDKLIDYVAMDIKNSRENYGLSVGIKEYNTNKINDSITYLLTSPIAYEFRTTIVKEHHTSEDIRSIGQWISGAKAYYLQSYKDSGEILSPGLSSHTKDTLLSFVKLLTPYVEKVELRGVD